METKSLVQTAVAVLVAVVVFSTVLIPVTTDATDHERNFYNIAYNDQFKMSNDEPVTISFDGTTYAINGEAVTPLSSSYSTISSDGLVIRWLTDHPTGRYLQDGEWKAIPATFTITAQNGHATGETEGSEFHFDYTFMYYQKAGNWTMTSGVDKFYVNGDTPIKCVGYNSSLGSYTDARFFIMEGTINDGFTMHDLTGREIQYKNAEYEKVNGMVDTYLVSSIVFDNNGADVFVNRCIVPDIITATEVNYPSADILVGIIPLLVIVGLILAVIGVAIVRRYDL